MERICQAGEEKCRCPGTSLDGPWLHYCFRRYGRPAPGLLVDLRSKYPDLTGKVAEKALVSADITVNKNMVPFDSRSAFGLYGIRLGTPAITTRGAKEEPDARNYRDD